MIQDKQFNADGTLFYPTEGISTVHPIWVPEFFGDTPVINGKAYPFLNAEPRRYRLRLLNGSQARFYNLHFKVGDTPPADTTDPRLSSPSMSSDPKEGFFPLRRRCPAW